MTVVAIVPARGGSKRIRRKNIADCGGKSLLDWTANAALASASLDQIILSTDDVEIADHGRELGLAVPFMRPDTIAEDAAPMLPVMRHVLDWAEEEGATIEALVLLQPTSPLRRAEHIDAAVGLFREREAESVVSVVEVPHQFHPAKLLQINATGGVEAYSPERDPNDKTMYNGTSYYGRNGPAVLVTRPEVIRAGKLYGDLTVPYVMAPQDSIDIDEPFDLWLADAILRQRCALEISK